MSNEIAMQRALIVAKILVRKAAFLSLGHQVLLAGLVKQVKTAEDTQKLKAFSWDLFERMDRMGTFPENEYRHLRAELLRLDFHQVQY